MMPQLRVSLLGRARFALGDEAFKFVGRPKTLPLLAHLLLQTAYLRQRAVARAGKSQCQSDTHPDTPHYGRRHYRQQLQAQLAVFQIQRFRRFAGA